MAVMLVALVAPFFAGGVGALEQGQPSKTSIMVAGCRAFASHDPDPSIRNPDWLAEQLIGPQERALIPDTPSIKALSMPYEEGLKNGSIGVCRMMLIRTRFIDDRLKEAVDAWRQADRNFGRRLRQPRVSSARPPRQHARDRSRLRADAGV